MSLETESSQKGKKSTVEFEKVLPSTESQTSKIAKCRDQTIISDYVWKAELNEIRRRRVVAFGEGSEHEQKIGDSNTPEGTDTVGLALSGGGIRSASFNLGLSQALIEKGLIRWVDLMSTVSGGGFIGTYLSTLYTHPKLTRLRDSPAPDPTDESESDTGKPTAPAAKTTDKKTTDTPKPSLKLGNSLVPLKGGGLPEPVDTFVRGGSYLKEAR